MDKEVEDFLEEARELVGFKPTEIKTWAHDAQVMIVAQSLLSAYGRGWNAARQSGKETKDE